MLHFDCVYFHGARFGANKLEERILGIDPGTATVGYGVLGLRGRENFRYIASGIIQTSKELSTGERLKIIRTDLLSLIEEYSPDVVVVEAIFFFKNAKTLVPVAQARGVILEAAAHGGVDVVEYSPVQVKLHLTGYGRAEKKAVQFMIAKLLGLPDIIKPDDASDALALAVCHTRAHLGPIRSREAPRLVEAL
jgi:crossover junction endodeoxyribonuclease RuvC